LTVTTTVAQLSSPFGIENKLNSLPGGHTLTRSLDTIRGKASLTDFVKWQILAPYESPDDFNYMNLLAEGIAKCRADDISKSPLKGYFEKSPNSRVLPVSDCAIPGEPGYPNDTRGMRVVRFADADQFQLRLTYSLIHEHLAQVDRAHKTSDTTLAASFLQLPHMSDNRWFLMVVDPSQTTGSLPQIGESADLTIEGVQRDMTAVVPEPSQTTEANVTDADVLTVASYVYHSVTVDYTEQNPVQDVHEHIDTYFVNPLTDEEIMSLLRKEGDSPADDMARREHVYSFIASKRDQIRHIPVDADNAIDDTVDVDAWGHDQREPQRRCVQTCDSLGYIFKNLA
jgi:hypothetical protein